MAVLLLLGKVSAQGEEAVLVVVGAAGLQIDRAQGVEACLGHPGTALFRGRPDVQGWTARRGEIAASVDDGKRTART